VATDNEEDYIDMEELKERVAVDLYPSDPDSKQAFLREPNINLDMGVAIKRAFPERVAKKESGQPITYLKVSWRVNG